MTTKPKTRTAPAQTVTEEPVSPPFDITTNNIGKLIARLRFLEADCRYHVAIGDPNARGVVMNSRHREERDEITKKLAKIVPEDFWSADELLKFATLRLKVLKDFDFMHGPLIAMLKNAGTGFFKARLDDCFKTSMRGFEERMNLLEDDAA